MNVEIKQKKSISLRADVQFREGHVSIATVDVQSERLTVPTLPVDDAPPDCVDVKFSIWISPPRTCAFGFT